MLFASITFFIIVPYGVYNLALDSNNFEITIYILITVLILIVSYIFTNINRIRD